VILRGAWTDLYDEEHEKWVRVYVELPDDDVIGVHTTLDQKKQVTIFGPDNRSVVTPPKRRVGF